MRSLSFFQKKRKTLLVKIMEISKADGKSCRWLFRLVYENSTIPLAPRFPARIPETVLFSDKSVELGIPVKWMRSSLDGSSDIDRLEFPIEARKALEKLQYVESSFSSNPKVDSEWFCRAWPVSPYDYKIGSEEKIDVHKTEAEILDKFRYKKRVSNRKWRKQTSILQVYNAQKGEPIIGKYKRGVPASTKADKLAKQIAIFVNKASVGSRVISRVKVVELSAQFVIDAETDEYWLISTRTLSTERPRGAHPNLAEVSVAMIHLREELCKLMIQAERRGMTYKDLWRHFGPQGKGDGFVNRHDLVQGFRELGFDEVRDEKEKDTSMEPGSVWMHLLGDIETNGRGNLSYKQFVKFIERLKRPERPNLKVEEKKKTNRTSSSLQSVRTLARDEERKSIATIESRKSITSLKMGRKKTKKNISLLGEDTRDSLKRSLMELQEHVGRNMLASKRSSHSSKSTVKSSKRKSDEIDLINSKRKEEDEDEDMIPTHDAHFYETEEIMQYYRVIIHKEIREEKQDNIKEASSSSRMIALAQSKRLRGLAKSSHNFSLVIFPDFFDTIDTLTAFAKPIAKTIPDCPILVLGHPIPRLRKDKKKKMMILNNETMSKHANELLQKAFRSQQIIHPCIAVGFGNGGNILIQHLINNAKKSSKLIRAAMVVNSFAHIDKLLRQNLTQLLRMSHITSHQEKMMFLGTLLFSDEFLQDSKRHDSLRDYFRGRKIFNRKKALRKSISRIIRGALHHQDLRDKIKTSLRCPLLILGASHDAFVSSKHSEVIANSMKQIADTVADCVLKNAATTMWLKGGHALAQERGRAVVSAIQRLAKGLLSYYTNEDNGDEEKRFGFNEGEEDEEDKLIEESEDEDEKIEWNDDLQRQKRTTSRPATASSHVSRPGTAQSSSSWRSRGKNRPLSRDSQHVEDEAGRRLGEIEAQNQARETEHRLRLEKEQREIARKRKEKARKLENSRKIVEETAQKIRDVQASKTETDMEREENRSMAYEERMTRFVLQHENKNAKYIKNQKDGQWSCKQLHTLRDEGIHRRNELREGLKVAEKRDMRRQMKEKQRKYLAQNQFALADIELEGSKLGYGIDTEKLLLKKQGEEVVSPSLSSPRKTRYETQYIQNVLQGSRRLRSDFDLILSHRKQALGAQRPIHEKMTRYLDSQVRMRKKLRIREKAMRNAKQDVSKNIKVMNNLKDSKRGVDKNRVIVLKERNARLEQERQRLCEQIKESNQDLADLAAKIRINKEEVDTVDRGVQQVILVQKRLVKVLDSMKSELLNLYTEATHRRTDLRHTLDNVEIRMDEVHEESEKDRKRESALLRELERVRPMKVKFVDTHVWQENVPQRIHLKKLKKFLKTECRKLRKMLENFETEAKELRLREEELHKDLKMTNHDIGEIQVELEDLEKTYVLVGVKRENRRQKMKKDEDVEKKTGSLKERADRKKKRDEKFELEERERENRAIAKKRRERYSICYKNVKEIKTEEMVRDTPASRHTLEERLWTALDMQLNPALYVL